MRKLLLSLFVLIFSHIGISAQVLSLTPHPLQNYQHPFNEEFIKRNDIQSIQVEISSKKEMDIIRPANRFLVFEFNEEGGLVSEKKFKIGETDTLNFAFLYTDDGKLLQEQEYIGSGILEKKYRYDENGNKSRVEYRKIDTYHKGSNIISIDSIRTIVVDGVLIQTYYNDQDRPYREVRVYKDSLGYLSKYRETFIISHKQNTIEYSYNDYGLLKEIDYYFAFKDKKRKEVYYYTEEGVPESFQVYEDGVLIDRKEYLYNGDGSLKAILFKEMETNLITIWELTYIKSPS